MANGLKDDRGIEVHRSHLLLERTGLVVLLLGTLYLLYCVFQPFLTGFIWAAFFVVAFLPIYERLIGWLKGREWLASVLLTLALGATLVVPSVFVVASVVSDVRELMSTIQSRFRPPVHEPSVVPTEPTVSPQEPPAEGFRAKIQRKAREYIQRSGVDLKTLIVELAQKVGGFIARQGGAILHNILQTFFSLLITMIATAVLFRYRRGVLDTLRLLVPLREVETELLLSRLKQVSRAVFFGVMLTALIQALLGGMGWWFVGLSSPVVFGFLMFFAALIPGVGTSIIWAPGAFYLFWNGQTAMAIALTVWGIAVIGMVDNFLRPIFIGGKTGFPMVLIFFSIAGGILAFGMSGLFIGPLVVTLFSSLLEIVRNHGTHEN